MAAITFINASVELPIYNTNSQSLKKRFISAATGGIINADDSGKVLIRALNNINLSFNHGDRVGIIGHNGSGKTTFLRVVAGIYPVTSGSRQIVGKVSSLIDLSAGFNPELTGRENIFLRGRLMGISKTKLTTKINEIINFTELGSFIDMPLRTYSSGMQLRLAFSISTLIEPEILIMDEWLSTGDKDFKLKAAQRMRDLLKATSILVIASHSRELALSICNKVIWLEHGSIKMMGQPDEICKAYFG